jgi:hypothetical protein
VTTTASIYIYRSLGQDFRDITGPSRIREYISSSDKQKSHRCFGGKKAKDVDFHCPSSLISEPLLISFFFASVEYTMVRDLCTARRRKER